MSDTNFLAGQASVWVQPGGPNTKPEYLGCHGVGDVEEPQGDVTLLYCPDPGRAGKFTVKNSFQGAPGSITTSLETDIRKTADYLEGVKCSVPLYVHKVTCGRRDDFTNFERTFVLRQSRITNKTLSNLGARSPDNEDESMQTFEFAAQELLRLFNLQANRVTIAETEHITAIAIGGEDMCESDCGSTQDYGDIIVAVTEADDYSTKANVIVTQTGGAPVATSNDPFAVGEDIKGALVFKVGKSTWRTIVGRGTTDAGNPMEIAYSDDFGVSAWTPVSVGVTNGEYITNSHALLGLDARNIWLGSNLGNIYYSEDAGITWTKQTTTALADNIAALSFFDDTYGFALLDNGAAYKTIDGGDTWSVVTVTGGTIGYDIAALGRYFLYAAASDGMFYSHDAGTTWTKRNSYNISAFAFRNELEGLAVGAGMSGKIYQTIDGGYTWAATPTVSNNGLRDVAWVNSSLAWVGGNTHAATGFLAKMIPVP